MNQQLHAHADFTFIGSTPADVQFFFKQVSLLIKDMQTEETLKAVQVKMETSFSVEDVFEISNRV